MDAKVTPEKSVSFVPVSRYYTAPVAVIDIIHTHHLDRSKRNPLSVSEISPQEASEGSMLSLSRAKTFAMLISARVRILKTFQRQAPVWM